MKTPIFVILSATFLLAACVSPQGQNALAALQGQCAAGNRDACTAAGYQARANQQESTNTAAIAAGVGAAVLGAAIVGAVVADDRYPHQYGHEDHRYRYYH